MAGKSTRKGRRSTGKKARPSPLTKRQRATFYALLGGVSDDESE